MEGSWSKEFPGAITVCDRDGIVLEINDKAAAIFASDGGRDLVGKNLLDCHPETARKMVEEMLQCGKKNVYTIEKNGIRKLIFQAPWFREGQYQGFVELALEIPFEMPHFVRQ
jgi:transcriptional regulator with PAS, ATPase and Fis domain